MDGREMVLQEARQAFESGDFKKSMDVYKSLLEADGENPDINYGLACACKAMKNDAEAIPAFEAALKARKGWPCAVKEYSDLLLSHRKTRTAFELVRTSIEMNPDDAGLYILAGKILLCQSNYEEAVTYLLRALELDAVSLTAFSMLSDCYFRLSENEEGLDAAVAAEKYAEESKKDEMQQRLVGAYMFAGQIENALPYLSAFSIETTGDVHILDLLGRAFIFKGDEDAVASCAEKINGIDSGYFNHLVSWAFCYRIIGKHEKSRDMFTEYLSENKKAAAIWAELGKTDELMGDMISAFDEYSTALAFDPANFLAKNGAGRLEPKEQVEDTSVSSGAIGEEVDLDFLMDSDVAVSDGADKKDGNTVEGETGVSSLKDSVPSGVEMLETKDGFSSEMMRQVSDLLPKIERIISNQDDAEKFSREIELFQRLRTLGGLLPEAQRQCFMQSNIRVLLDFLIARLSGSPGLLKTADSLRKSGVIDSELKNSRSDDLEECSLARRSIKLLNILCDFAGVLEDKCMAAVLIKMARETAERLCPHA